MATLSALVSKVEQKIDDESFTADNITSLLNEGRLIISGAVKLPELDATAEVTTDIDDNFVSLPDDYQRGLYRCRVKATGREVRVLNSIGQLGRYTGGMEGTGDVTHVAPVGRRLYYQGKPAVAVVLVLSYYRKPTPMVDNADEPTELPDNFQMPILVSYAMGELHDGIEDALEGQKQNTTWYQGKFLEQLDKLGKEIREGVSNPPPPTTGCDV